MHIKEVKTVTESGVVSNSPCEYFGFESCHMDGVDRQVEAWNSPTTVAGQKVEDYLLDGNKKSDGHDLGDPIYCTSGLYFGTTVECLVYFHQFVLQKKS